MRFIASHQYHSLQLLSFSLIAVCTFVGCNNQGSTVATKGSTANKPQDDPASVEAIEKLGGKIKKDGNGLVTEVDFRGTEVADGDLGALAGLKNLRSLKLSETKITDAGMPAVTELKSLTNLDLRECKIGDEGLANIAALSKLKALRLSNKNGSTEVSDAVMPQVAKLSNLKVLGIDFLYAGSAEGIASLAGLPIEEFYASHSLVDDECLAVIAEKLPKVKKLRVSGCNVSGEGLQAIGRMSNLQELDLSEIALIMDSDLTHLSGSKQLKKLNLWRVQVTDEGVASLAGLSNMEWLNLDNVAYLSDEGLVHLKDMTKLKFLHVGSTSVGDAGLPNLAHLTSLADLKVTRTAVTQAGVDELKKSLANTAIQLEYEGGSE